MRRLALIAVLSVAMGLALGAGLVLSQTDPWWHPINPRGQSAGVTYGTHLPTLANTGYPPADGLLAVVLNAGSQPNFQIYDQSSSSWLSLVPGGGGSGLTNDYVPKWDGTNNWLEDSVLRASGVPAEGLSGSLIDITATINPMRGGLIDGGVKAIDISLTNADHTGVNNYLYAMWIGNITGDADAIEDGIRFGTGWDYDVYFADATGNNIASAGPVDVVLLTTSWFAVRRTTTTYDFTVDMRTTQDFVKLQSKPLYLNTDYLALTPTAEAMDGSDIERGIFIDIANADHGGADNYLYGADVDNITGDAQALEYAYNAGTGWDAAFHHAGIAFASLQAAGNGSIVFCTNCDPASTPCTSAGAQTGAFAFRVNGQWDCPW